MKKIFFLILLLCFYLVCQAQLLQLSLTGRSFYNSMKASAIDVDFPNNQPVIFRLLISNQYNAQLSEAYIHFQLHWNDNVIIEESISKFRENAISNLNLSIPINISNRDLIRNEGSDFLYKAEPSLSLSDFLNNRHFKDSILNTGLFPDGDYRFVMVIKDQFGIPLSNSDAFVMSIKNIYNLSLISPGVQVGSDISEVSATPVLFLWSSSLINENNLFKITIREFAQVSTININNIEDSGRLFFEIDNLRAPIFNQILPFIEGNYYAWKVSTNLTTEQVDFDILNDFSSPWNVFKFVTHSPQAPNPYQNVIDYLQSLQHPFLNQILADGYVPTGRFFHYDRSISISELSGLIEEIMNSNILNIELID